jgi:hypothetical protein
MAKLKKLKTPKVKLKLKKLGTLPSNLAKRGVIGPTQVAKLRSARVGPRGGVGKGMAGA